MTIAGCRVDDRRRKAPLTRAVVLGAGELGAGRLLREARGAVTVLGRSGRPGAEEGGELLALVELTEGLRDEVGTDPVVLEDRGLVLAGGLQLLLIELLPLLETLEPVVLAPGQTQLVVPVPAGVGAPHDQPHHDPQHDDGQDSPWQVSQSTNDSIES